MRQRLAFRRSCLFLTRRSPGGLAAALLLFLAAPGCNRDDAAPNLGAQVAAPAVDEFDAAIEMIENAEDFDPEQARREAVNRLNRWIEQEEPSNSWIADPLIGRLPPHLRDTILFKNLDEMKFGMPDARYLQQATWLRDLAQWIRDSQLDPLSKRRLEETQAAGGDMSSEQVEQLRLSLVLFDWTVRNIQLDRAATAASGGSETAPPTGDDGKSAINAPGRGVPGPGYTMFPWQVLQFGHGDSLQRASVFLLLCHQLGVEGVMLGFEGPPPAPARPWVTATLIGGQLYLFDTELGLALPGKDGKGVATLSQVVADPSLLRALDCDDGQGARYEYPATADDLAKVTALICAPVESLSQRMRLLETRLVGQKKMALTTTPSLLSQKLKKLPEIKNVALWTAPFDTLIYRIAIEQQAQANPEAFRSRFEEESLFTTVHPLVIGRRLHLRGELDRKSGAEASSTIGASDLGAKGMYLQARMTDREIEAVRKSEEAQKTLKLARAPGEDQESWENRFQSFVRFVRDTRPYANYWLGLAHYENRNFDSSATWLANQVLADETEQRWRSGARYNHGRALECLGKTAEAIEDYRQDASPQRHGNLLRARWLESQASTAENASSAASASGG